MSPLTLNHPSGKNLLFLAFIATLVINALALLILTLVFDNDRESIFFAYSFMAMLIISFAIWVTFKRERSLFWPYLAAIISASLITIGVLVIVNSLLNWLISLFLVLGCFVALGFNVANLVDKNSPCPKFNYVFYQLLSAFSILVYYWYFLPK